MDLRLLTSGLSHHRLLLCAIQCAWYVFSSARLAYIVLREKLSRFLVYMTAVTGCCKNSVHSISWPEVLNCILNLKISFSQSLSLHGHLSLPRADLLEL